MKLHALSLALLRATIVPITLIITVPVLAADAALSSTTASIVSSAVLPSDPLTVPPIRSWLRKIHDEPVKEPEIVALIKNYNGQEPFHEDPKHRAMLSAHLIQLMCTLNDGTVKETVEFLTLCEQKSIQIDEYIASDDLFRLAYHKRTQHETNYKTHVETQIDGYKKCRMNHIEQIRNQLMAQQKTAENNAIACNNACSKAKTLYEPLITPYSTIMQLVPKIDSHYRPTYAVNPALYYENIEQQFTLTLKMQEQAAFAAHLQEINKLIAEANLMGKAPTPVQSSQASSSSTTTTDISSNQ